MPLTQEVVELLRQASPNAVFFKLIENQQELCDDRGPTHLPVPNIDMILQSADKMHSSEKLGYLQEVCLSDNCIIHVCDVCVYVPSTFKAVAALHQGLQVYSTW